MMNRCNRGHFLQLVRRRQFSSSSSGGGGVEATTATATATTSLKGHEIEGKVDWSRVLGRCAPEVRKTVLETRARHEDLRRQIAELKASQPKLDWDKYREVLGASEHLKSVFEQIERDATAFKPKPLNIEPMLQDLEVEKTQKIDESKQFLANLEAEIGKLRHQLDKLQSAKPIEEMTVDDVYAIHPEAKAKFQRDLIEDNWSSDPTYDRKAEEAKETTAHGHH